MSITWSVRLVNILQRKAEHSSRGFARGWLARLVRRVYDAGYCGPPGGPLAHRPGRIDLLITSV